MPPRRRSKASAPVELPEPLWAKIASHMAAKDWAMVSGICKTTFNLQPRTINIPSATPPAGVIWASKRLGNVEVLRLSPNGALGLAGLGGQDSNTLMHLKQLEVGAPSAADTPTAFKIWLAWVLSRAQKLSLLSAVVGQFEWFPPLMQLKHLVLRCNGSTGNIFAALSHAKSLQTLSLHAGQLSGGAMELEAPRLELGSLPDLRAVALHGVCPDHTFLPKECGLHLDGLVTLDDLEDEKWESASANLRSLDFVKKCLVLPQLPDLFGNFQKWQNLSTVYLEVGKCGAADAPVLLANLAHVQQLYFGAVGQLYVTVPAKVSWQKLSLCGFERLQVTFEDLDAFARTVKNCAFTSENFAGPSLFQLCLTLAEHGTPWATCVHDDGEASLAFPTQDAGDFSECYCGACMKCLRGSGVAEACSNVSGVDQASGLAWDYNDTDEDQDEDEEDDEDED